MSLPQILITGGSGLLGRHLTDTLLDKGYQVSHLSRHRGRDSRVKTYIWDIDKGKIEDSCLEGADIIIHLAGAGIADKKWTEQRKDEVIDSRTKSIELIYELMRHSDHHVKRVISASGTGYYSHRGKVLLNEGSVPARDFLGKCCFLWEQSVDKGKEFGIKILKFRTGVVLTTEGGALPVMSKPIRWGFGAALGNGKQWVPWIHHQDVTDMYMFAIENEQMEGVYNMVAPNPVTNRQLTSAIARQLKKPLWLPNVPASLLKIFMGEMSKLVLASTRVSAAKIEAGGFRFKFPEIEDALKDIYG